jgi:S-disulfanyl-L-cysteine oxidoreductase SoxD
MGTARKVAALVVVVVWSASPSSVSVSIGRHLYAQAPTFGLGHTPTPDHLKAIDIDVTPDGKGLAPGTGTASGGKDVYTRRCEACHGPTGREGPQDVLVGGQGSLATTSPVKTVGSYWPYATTLFDYIRRAMPFTETKSLTADEVYAVSAYILNLNGIVGAEDVLDAKSLPKVKMPNRDGFVLFPRNPKKLGPLSPTGARLRSGPISAAGGAARR